jgi:hypothetical protein
MSHPLHFVMISKVHESASRPPHPWPVQHDIGRELREDRHTKPMMPGIGNDEKLPPPLLDFCALHGILICLESVGFKSSKCAINFVELVDESFDQNIWLRNTATIIIHRTGF